MSEQARCRTCGQTLGSDGPHHRWLLALGDTTIRELQERLEDRGVKGSGYSNVHRVVHGGDATIPFIAAAADILDVDPGWLAFGTGSMRPANPEGDHG